MMSDLIKILLNIGKSKRLEINTKSISRGLSEKNLYILPVINTSLF